MHNDHVIAILLSVLGRTEFIESKRPLAVGTTCYYIFLKLYFDVVPTVAIK